MRSFMMIWNLLYKKDLGLYACPAISDENGPFLLTLKKKIQYIHEPG